MAADIVERLRGHWRAAGQGCTYLCMMCAAADEIERLRAGSQRWEESSDRWYALAERLQELIDAFAAASAEGDQYDHLRYMRAIGDLLDNSTIGEAADGPR